MTTNEQEKRQVEATIQEWKSALLATDPDRLRALWDQDYPQLLYIAEENDDPITEWAAISKYYDGLREFVEKLDWGAFDLSADVLGDAAYAYVSFSIKAKVKGIDHAMEFNGRNTFILHQKGGQWKIIHFHESLSRDNSHSAWSFLWS